VAEASHVPTEDRPFKDAEKSLRRFFDERRRKRKSDIRKSPQNRDADFYRPALPVAAGAQPIGEEIPDPEAHGANFWKYRHSPDVLSGLSYAESRSLSEAMFKSASPFEGREISELEIVWPNPEFQPISYEELMPNLASESPTFTSPPYPRFLERGAIRPVARGVIDRQDLP
jgi:hypothetical protein